MDMFFFIRLFFALMKTANKRKWNKHKDKLQQTAPGTKKAHKYLHNTKKKF